MLFHRSRTERLEICVDSRRRSLSARGTFGGGGGGGVPSSTSITYLPRSTGDVRFDIDVSVRMLPCPSKPEAIRIGQRARAGSRCPARSECRSACASRSSTNV